MSAGKVRVPPAFMKVRKRRRPFRVERLLKKQQASESTPWSESGRAQRLLKTGAPTDPPKLKTELLPHQERVIERLKSQQGLVVAHGLGSGKTLSSIGAVVDLNPQEARVVVPASLQENYRKEVEKHVQGQLPVTVESLQKAVKDGNPPRGDLVIVDEAHRIRNPTSKGYQLMRNIGEGKKMLLTASPVYNLPEDVAPLVNVAAGDKVLPEGATFRQRYVQKPGRSIFTVINPWARKDPKIVNKKELGRVLNKWVDYHGNSEEGYPVLEQERINVPMTKRQSKLHAEAWGELPWIARMRHKKGLPPDKKDLAALNRFQSQTRQISSSTKKYELEGVQHEISPKVEEAVDRLKTKMDTNPEHKALVYANYLGTLDDYSKRLEEENVPHAFFRGDTSKKVRDQAIRDFNEGKVKALLVSGAGGEGLDLKGTRQVQVLEPHWNEEKLRQVIGRARRYQSHDHLPENERTVTVERYAAQPRTLFGTKKGIEDILYDTAAQKQRLNDQVLNLITKTGAVVAPKSGEFAPGIPQDRKIESIQRIREKGKNYDWDLSVTHHPAERRGDHLDLRLVDQKGRAHSWALPEELPRPGKSSYAVQQPTHTKEYALKEEPFELPEGYGKTRPGALVTPIALGKAEVVAANNHKVRFVHHRGGESQEFVLRKIDAKAPGAGPMWALHNATKNVHTVEGQKLPQYRRKYTAVEPEDVDTADDSQVMTAKIDGAHTLTALHGDKGFNRIYSYRKPAARETGVIEHTMKVPDFHKQRSPKDLKGTILRTEMWFSDKEGKPLPAAQVGGLLNSGVLKSRTKQEELGVKPRLTVIDVDRFKGRKVEDKPFEQKLEMMREVVDKVDMLELPPMARTQAEKEKLLKDLKAGRVTETKEGVVLRDLAAKGDVPIKAVFKPLHDVYVRDVFTKERGKARGHAGGFAYSWTPDGPVVGRVGTGFDHAMRREMLENPDKFVGRVAMVKSPGVTPKGALRGAPSFKGWHPDKNDPELMKEAAHLLRKKKETEEPEMKKTAALGTIARDFSRGVLPGAMGGGLVGAGVGAGAADEGERMLGAGRGALIGALSGGLAGGGLRAGLMPKLRGVKERAFNKAQAQAEEMGRRADLTEAVAKHWGTRMDDITREARKATGPRQQQLRNEWAEATEKFDEAVNVTTDFRAAQRTAQDEMAAQSGPVTLPGIVPGTVGGLIAAPMAYFGRKKEKTGAPLRPGVLGRLGDFGAGALPGAAGGAIGGGLLGTRDFVVGEDASEADRLRSGLRGAAIGALAGGSISGAMSGMARHTQRLENAQDLKRYAADVAHHKRNARDSAAEIERLIKNEPAGRQSTEEWWQWKQDLNRAQSDHRTATEGAGMYEGFVRDMEREPAIRFKPGVMGGIGAAMGIPAAYLGRKKEKTAALSQRTATQLMDFGEGALRGGPVGALVGSGIGALSSDEGERLRGALRGGALGAAVGGAGAGLLTRSQMGAGRRVRQEGIDLAREVSKSAKRKADEAYEQAVKAQDRATYDPSFAQQAQKAKQEYASLRLKAMDRSADVWDWARQEVRPDTPRAMAIGGLLAAPTAYLGRKKEPEQAKTAGAGKSYGPGGKWIHDRAHRIMEEGETEKQYGKKDGKSVAYAIAAQQSHRLGKSPKGFRTAEGVRTARRKYDQPRKEYQKTAGLVGPNGLTTEGALFLLRQPSPNLGKVAAAASVPTKKLDPKRAKDLLRKLLGEPAGGVNPLNPGSGIKGMLTKNRMM